MHIEVSDHAVLRYMQRVMGVDVEDLRETIGMMIRSRIPAGINDAVVTIDGVSFTIKGGVLITLYKRNSSKQRSQLEEGHRGK